jgi:hypothetical protein
LQGIPAGWTPGRDDRRSIDETGRASRGKRGRRSELRESASKEWLRGLFAQGLSTPP